MPDAPKPKLSEKNVGKARIVLDEISLKYDEYTEDKDAEVPSDYKEFINYSRRGTTDTGARVYRTTFTCRKLQDAI